MGDVGVARGYRTKEEMEQRWLQEPVQRFRKYLLEKEILTGPDLAVIDQQIEKDIQEAVDFVNSSPAADVSKVAENIYA